MAEVSSAMAKGLDSFRTGFVRRGAGAGGPAPLRAARRSHRVGGALELASSTLPGLPGIDGVPTDHYSRRYHGATILTDSSGGG